MGRRGGAVESLVMRPAFWQGRRVLVSGHTGFKGTWLCAWLDRLGAEICGFALPPHSSPGMYQLIEPLATEVSHYFDINEGGRVSDLLDQFAPEVVFHLAAQSLVRPSYDNPAATFETNVLGTISLLDAVRKAASVKAVVVVTSDKCYEIDASAHGYREEDRLGGGDPYSASKGCAEIAARSMQQSFFAPYAAGGHPARIATVRAGNVIGGGDWSADRLVPDIVRGCLGSDAVVRLRYPHAIRPWQHVLEPLRGYIEIAERLVSEPDGMDAAWNFGPGTDLERTVQDIARSMVAALKRGTVIVDGDANLRHETEILRLDCSKARDKLGWRPILTYQETIALTAAWYLAWAAADDMRAITATQIFDYSDRLVSVSP